MILKYPCAVSNRGELFRIRKNTGKSIHYKNKKNSIKYLVLKLKFRYYFQYKKSAKTNNIRATYATPQMLLRKNKKSV